MRLCVSSRHLDIYLLQELIYELDLFCTLGSVVIVVTNLVSFLSLENESRILFLLYKKLYAFVMIYVLELIMYLTNFSIYGHHIWGTGKGCMHVTKQNKLKLTSLVEQS
jgi:hypothetical protein